MAVISPLRAGETSDMRCFRLEDSNTRAFGICCGNPASAEDIKEEVAKSHVGLFCLRVLGLKIHWHVKCEGFRFELETLIQEKFIVIPDIPNDFLDEQPTQDNTQVSVQSEALTRILHRECRLPTHLQDYILSNDNDLSDEEIIQFALFAYCDPISCEDAAKKTHWLKAMDEEIQAIGTNGTWELIELPPRKEPVGVKCVYKTKYKSNGEIDHFKTSYSDDGIFVAQKKYASDILKRFRMECSKSVPTPVIEKIKLSKDETEPTASTSSEIGGIDPKIAFRTKMILGFWLLSPEMANTLEALMLYWVRRDKTYKDVAFQDSEEFRGTWVAEIQDMAMSVGGGEGAVDHRDLEAEFLRAAGWATILLSSTALLRPPHDIPLFRLLFLLLLFAGCAMLFASFTPFPFARRAAIRVALLLASFAGY
ncbi:hypothetical protein ZIOFF_044838 [Zingiber officinale]|uniref:Uncharacterized protein n=1 Tax=Zingiber officinale TaxID=94328 RepID=A0A8J5KRH6_ZINOF|nr:hypothetical protein ZIOFF_044838 [Zingiber officinale]